MRRELPPNKYSTPDLREIYVLPALVKQKYFTRLTDGCWDIEWDQVQAEENHTAEKILRVEQVPLSLPEIRKRVSELLAKDISEVRIDLDSDPKFAAVGANHYALSEWDLLNDDAYELLAREPGRSLTQDEILRRLQSAGQFLDGSSVFAPKADQRFKRTPDGKWGLAEWWPTGAKKKKQVITDVGLPIPIQVTYEHQTRVNSNAVAIKEFVRASRDAVRPRQIVEYVLGVVVGSADYPPLVRAVHTFLESAEAFIRVGPEAWRLKTQVPEAVWQEITDVLSPRVRDQMSSRSVDEEQEPESGERALESGGAEPAQDIRTWKVVLRFVHWQAGTLRVPTSKLALFPTFSGDVTELHILLFGSVSKEYPVWLNRTNKTIYGLRPVYDALGMIPGSIFNLAPAAHLGDQITLRYNGEIDQRVLREQSRLMDRDAMQRRAKEIGRSFLSILVDVMRNHPSGLSFWEIFDQVSGIRPVAIATLRNLLSGRPCFYQNEPGSARWYFDATKPLVRRHRRQLRPQTPHHPVRNKPSATELVRSGGDGSVGRQDAGNVDNQAEVSLHDNTGEHDDQLAAEVTNDKPSYTGVQIEGMGPLENGRSSNHHAVSVRDRVAVLLAEGIVDDKVLIREYLSRYHDVTIDRSFILANVPPPETIRRSRQLLLNTGAVFPDRVENLTTVRGRVRALLREEVFRRDDRKLIVAYYEKHHGIGVSSEYFDPGVPSMETIRRARQEITGRVRSDGQAEEEEPDPDWGWGGTPVPNGVSGMDLSRRGDWQQETQSKLTSTGENPVGGRTPERSSKRARRPQSRWKRLARWFWNLIWNRRAAR
jgi:hypothetical protein